MVFFGLIRGMPGFRATRSAAALAAALVAASVLCAEAVPPPPPDPEWQHAENLCAKRLWADAEKAFLVYSRRVPEPPRRADALVKAGVCRLMLRDPSAARRHFEKAAYDEVARRKSPEAVAEAFDRLHALLLDEGKPASLRARVLDDCRHRLPACVVLPRMREREGDALLAVGRHRQSLDCYDAAGAGLSPGGTNVVRLLRECLAANPPPLAEADAVRLAAAAGAKPASAAALCALLAKRDEGWLGEDVQARLLMGSGKASEAAAVWEAMLRGRRGPADRIALSHCEALAAGEPTKGLEAFGAWLGRYPDSSLRERAEACYALLLAKHGDLAEAASRLESFLKEHPGSRYAPEVDQALATARNASKRLEQIKAEQAAKAGERRRDPALAEIEQAEALLSKGRYDGAVKVFMAFRNRRRHPLWGRAWFGLGKARHALGDTGGALAAWDDLWRRSLTDTNVLCAAEARRAAGDAWLEDFGDPVRALKAYDETAARAPAAGENASDLNHGLALLMLGRGAEAAAVFTRRRDAAGADKAEFLRWDNLVDLCADDRPAAPPRSLLPAERRAHADLVLADGLFAAGEHSRALKLYRRAAVPLAGREGADRCDLQAARTLAALGRTKDALALYARFESEHRQSPLAPAALLYAGTLCAAPGTSDFAKAREWFAKIIDNHPGTPEAEAAEFYTATLAWRGRKWAEAERLHKAFAANHPDSPLARVALDERLPAIAKKSLAVPLHDPVDRTVTVYVSPYDRKRKAIPIVNTNAFNAHLDIRPASGYVLVDSEITLQNSRRNISCLWTGPDPKTASLHRYHLAAAFSCEEYVQVDGTIARPTSGGSGRPPPFRVTVPSVDVDWEDFADWSHEDGEDARRVIVPLNTNRVDDIRWLWVQIPYDDYGIVHPFLTLHCVDANALCLLHEAGTSFPNGGQIDSRAVPSWPIRFRAEPLAPTTECIVRVLGEADNVTGEKAVDTIRARVVNVDLDVDANHDGAITVADEPLEETAGGYVCVGTNSLAPVKLTLEPKTGLPGKLTLSATMGDGRIQVWTNIARTSQMTLPKVWNAGEAVPGTLYVEGITPSAAARDVELRLEYDENPQGQNNPLFKCADVVRLTILKVDLKEVSYSGTDNHTLQSDDQITTFSAPHYLDANLDGDANDAGDRCYPVCYTRNKKMKTGAEFKVAPSPTAAATKIRGDGPGNVDIPETTGTLAGDTITLAATEAANAFANEIDLMKPMTINWQVSFDGGITWCDAGRSTNFLYVTWDSPEQATPIQTLVDVGCDAAHGQTGTVGTDDDDVLDKVWTRRHIRSIHWASDAFVLTYYGFYDANGNGTWDAGVDTDRNDPGSCTVTDAEGLISTANGQCHSWADFMNEVMKAQGLSSINGVSSKRVAIVIKSGDVAFAVQNWAKTGNSPRKIIDADAGVDGTSPTAPNPTNDEAADVAGADGQGNSPNPPSHFGNHWITKMNGKFFDPSYGLGPYTDQKAYEDYAFEGSIDQVGPDYFLRDLPADNSNPTDHSDEINDYTELAFP